MATAVPEARAAPAALGIQGASPGTAAGAATVAQAAAAVKAGPTPVVTGLPVAPAARAEQPVQVVRPGRATAEKLVRRALAAPGVQVAAVAQVRIARQLPVSVKRVLRAAGAVPVVTAVPAEPLLAVGPREQVVPEAAGGPAVRAVPAGRVPTTMPTRA